MRKLLLVFVTVMLTSTFVFAKSPADIPLEAFFKDAQFTNMEISPDGKHLAVIYDTGNSNTLAIMDTGLTEIKAKINFGEFMRIDGNIMWPRNDRFILSYSKFVGYLDTKGSNPIYVAYDLDGKNGRQLTVPQRTWYRIISMLPSDPTKILVTKSHWADQGQTKLWTIDVDRGKESYIGGEPRGAQSIIADSNGIPRFATAYEEEEDDAIGKGKITFFVKQTPTSEWRKVSLPDLYQQGTRISLLGFNADNTIAYVSSDIKTKVPSIYAVDLATLKSTLIHEETVADIGGRGELYNGALETVAFSRDYNRMVFLSEDSEMKTIMTQLYATFGIDDTSSNMRITSFTEDGNQLVFNISSDRDPGVFYLFNRGLDGSSPSIRELAVAKREIDPNLMAPMTPIKFTSRDGIELRGYKVIPITGEAPYPMVQIIHGGPHGPRDYWGWNREAQFLASRGYAVVMVNFRGSGGYGDAFERSGYQEWGGKMINDMTDATMWMVEKGYADKDRLCVYGGSYGGYGTLQSLVREPDLYKCGIGYVGVYDLFEMKKAGDIPKRESGRKFLDQVLGTDEKRMREFSPALNVEKIKAELFIAHGSDDVRVPMEQYESLSENLKRIGKPYISMIRDEGHGYQKDKNKYDFYSQMERFLAEHIGE
ncbi:prolyl oligopeptidase family serine peptidase [Alteromonas sp. LMIT006]|uniref:alpha/beta hydrolase family protein n=1 Tax=Alteromonadaceae TaxID=72275 RepID=UPI0020CA74D4|nr:prolyl oligopeptidase family serine peptidase [Alteromonas sp. LMIT006]UTP71728.1 prolyl oligopeptidase family serine peptidase [Alteromonas sp. LMIT006]